MTIGNFRPATVLIDETAILHNVQHEVARLKKKTQLFAVVKADAYGHGMLRVARVAKAAGASGFCVALLDEALDLRDANFVEPILVLGIVPSQYAAMAAAQTISLPISSVEWLEQALPVLEAQPELPPLRIHLALDTGMGRIGFTEDQALLDALKFIQEHPKQFTVEGIFTHFATADDPDDAYFKQQVAKFNHMVDLLPTRPRYVHVSNSATSLWHAACNGNMIRYGVAIYGLNPSGDAIPTTPFPLEPALSLESELTYCKQVHAGDGISYGVTYRAKGDEFIGTVPIGYADGWLRRLQGFHVLVDGHACEIVGRICMDQFMIRLPKAYPAGTKVVLIGQSGEQEITLLDVAKYSDTIHYEIACNLTPRLKRQSINLIGK